MYSETKQDEHDEKDDFLLLDVVAAVAVRES